MLEGPDELGRAGAVGVPAAGCRRRASSAGRSLLARPGGFWGVIWVMGWYNGAAMDEIAEKIELRNRVMRRMFQQLSFEERVARSDALVAYTMDTLRAYPEGFERFYRRNLKQRAVTPRHVEVPRH